MRIVLNGEPRDLPERATVSDAVRESGAGAPASGVAVAVAGEVVPRGEWDARALHDDDRVEVVRAVQGG